MGGKQKRAAKLKRLTAAGLLNQEENKNAPTNAKVPQDGSGDHASDYEPVPYEVQMEILKRRQKQLRKDRETSWASRRVRRIVNAVHKWPSWIVTSCLLFAVYVFGFFLVRFLIQAFVPGVSDMDRSSLFANIPTPFYKICLLLDYLFVSKDLSFQGVYHIIFPPHEYPFVKEHEYRFGAHKMYNG